MKRLAAERDALQRRVSRFQAAGRTETAAGQSALEEQVEFYKKLVKCPLACNRDKSVVTKCGHSFCRECIDHRLNLRNRKCPTCSVVIDCTPAHVPPAAPGHAPPASKPRRRPRAARRPTCSSPSRRAAPRSAIRSGPDAAVAHFLSPLRRGRRGTRARGGGDDGTPRMMKKKAQNPSTVERKTLPWYARSPLPLATRGRVFAPRASAHRFSVSRLHLWVRGTCIRCAGATSREDRWHAVQLSLLRGPSTHAAGHGSRLVASGWPGAHVRVVGGATVHAACGRTRQRDGHSFERAR